MAMIKCPECNGDLSEKAITCPHCGYPLKDEQFDYILVKGEKKTSRLASLLRVLAVIIWIIGLIAAIAGAKVSDSLYSGSTHFSLGSFIVLLIPYTLYGVIMFGMATLADQIANTNGIVSGLKLYKKPTDKKDDLPANGRDHDWICPVCGHTNYAWNENCNNCGERKK